MQSFAQVVALHGEREPKRVALIDGDEEITFAELGRQASILSSLLESQGVSSGDCVAFLGENSPEFFSTFLACQALGAVFLPLNYRFAEEQLKQVIGDAAISALVIRSEFLELGECLTASFDGPRILASSSDLVPASWLRVPDSTLALAERSLAKWSSKDVALLTFTSGTTGRAKGVPHCLGEIRANHAALSERAPADASSRHLIVAPLFHTAPLGCFSLRLLELGGTSILERSFDATRTLQLLEQQRVSHLFCVPAMLHAMTRGEPWAATDLSALRVVIAAGAPVASELISAYLARGVRVQQAYGLTEVLFATCVRAEDVESSEGRVGPPLAGFEMRLTSENGVVVNPDEGAHGELWLKGPSVLSNYTNAPEENRRALPGEGWFRTGDIVEIDAQESLRIVDRAKDMILVGGENVYSREVESAISAMPEVAEVAVVGQPDETWGERVSAAVVVKEQHTLDLPKIRAFLEERLADYMRPRALLVRHELPRNAMGKVDKGVLRREFAEEQVAARLTREGSTRGVVRRLLRAQLGAGAPALFESTHRFSDLGFGSLDAVEFAAALTAELGFPVPSTLAFDYPTVGQVDALLESWGAGAEKEEIEPQSASWEEPIAVVALGCRFPGGVSTPEQLWTLLERGGEVLGDFPADRGWDLEQLFDADPGVSGRSYVSQGAFLDQATHFDAEFFGISEREAEAMDPQQRVMLEICSEAFERAGLKRDELRGSSTGVFCGVMYHEYGARLGGAPARNEGYLTTGAAGSVVSGRVAYHFGLEGPAVTLDTACSSSLVAIHQACRALQAGDCTMALAGGVTVMSTPSTYIEFSRQRGLSPDARCRAYSSGANGTGFGEGAGVVLLEPLSRARRLGHPVLAVVRATGTNQDGASNGLTAPSAPSQTKLLKSVLRSAGLGADALDAIEGHGTGTALGDPIEIQALSAAFAERTEPLYLGSIKSNLGHSQGAAGVAGLIKMVLSLQAETLPQTLHAEEPSEHIRWNESCVRVLSQAREWKRSERPRRCGVSAFGASGTNAHLVLEEAPDLSEAAEEPTQGSFAPWLCLSSHQSAARAALATALAEPLESGRLTLEQLRVVQATHRESHRERIALFGEHDEVVSSLRALAQFKEPDPDRVVEGSTVQGDLVWVFPGQGSQWEGMGRELLEQSPVFREHVEQVARAFRPYVDWSLQDLLRGPVAQGAFEQVDVIQPVLFAMHTSLARVWESWGVVPDAVVGHSQGEIAAAYIAGILSLDDAARIVCLRSRSILPLVGKGGMLAIAGPADELSSFKLEPWASDVSLAVRNAPSAIVLSGRTEALSEIKEVAEARGWSAKRVRVDYGSHSPQIESIRRDVVEALRDIRPDEGKIPFFSSRSARQLSATELTAEYWYASLRDPVRFDLTCQALLDAEVRRFCEVSAHPVLLQAVEAHLDDLSEPGATLPTLIRDQGGLAQMHRALAQHWARGGSLRTPQPTTTTRTWARWAPTVRFQRKPYFIAQGRDQGRRGHRRHPVLSSRVELAGTDTVVLSGLLDLRGRQELLQHGVLGIPLVPGTLFLELALEAGLDGSWNVVDELTLEKPLRLEPESVHDLQVTVEGADATARVVIHSRPAGGDSPWIRHAQGRLGRARVAPDGVSPQTLGRSNTTIEQFYLDLQARGYDYGEGFALVSELFASDSLLGATVRPASNTVGENFSPAQIDAALHPIAWHGEGIRLPFLWSGVQLSGSVSGQLHVQLEAIGAETYRVLVWNEEGELCLSAEELVTRPVEEAELRRILKVSSGHTLQLREIAPVEDSVEHPWAVASHGDVPDPWLTQWSHGGRAFDWRTFEDVQALSADENLVFLWGASPDTPVVATQRALSLACGLADQEEELGRRMVLVAFDDATADASCAAAWAALGVARREFGLSLRLVDCAGQDPSDRSSLVQGLKSQEDDLLWHEGSWTARCVVPLGRESAGDVDLEGGTLLITGGTGHVGQRIARRAVEKWNPGRIVLVSRGGGDASELVPQETTNVPVIVKRGDVTDEAWLSATFESLRNGPPLAAVVHTAGALEDATVRNVSPAQLERVFAAKFDGLKLLDLLTNEFALKYFAATSSISTLMSQTGQSAYCAANAALEGLMRNRRAAGKPATIWTLGDWGGGMTRELTSADRARLERTGVAVLDQDGALDDLEVALEASSDVISCSFDMKTLRERDRTDDLPAVLRSLMPAATSKSPPSLERLSLTGSEAQMLDTIVSRLSDEVRSILGWSNERAVSLSQPFKQLGLDSLGAVELRNRLRRATGLTLASTMVFQHPTVAELGGALLKRLQQAQQDPPAPDDKSSLPAEPHDELISNVISLLGRHPNTTPRGAHFRSELERLMSEDEGAEERGASAEQLDVEEASLQELFNMIDNPGGSNERRAD